MRMKTQRGGVSSFATDVVKQKRYRDTSFIRKRLALGTYCRPMPRVLGGSEGGWRFFMGEGSMHRIMRMKTQRGGVSSFATDVPSTPPPMTSTP